MGCRFTPPVRLYSLLLLLEYQGLCISSCTTAIYPLPSEVPTSYIFSSAIVQQGAGGTPRSIGAVQGDPHQYAEPSILLHFRDYSDRTRTPENVENWSSPAACSTNAVPHMREM